MKWKTFQSQVNAARKQRHKEKKKKKIQKYFQKVDLSLWKRKERFLHNIMNAQCPNYWIWFKDTLETNIRLWNLAYANPTTTVVTTVISLSYSGTKKKPGKVEYVTTEFGHEKKKFFLMNADTSQMTGAINKKKKKNKNSIVSASETPYRITKLKWRHLNKGKRAHTVRDKRKISQICSDAAAQITVLPSK